MSKAVLIIDMPSCCDDCPCFDGMEDRSDCKYLKKEVKDFLRIDKDCPLKLLPQKKGVVLISEKESPFEFYERIGYAKGHDDCIDEILGEE